MKGSEEHGGVLTCQLTFTEVQPSASCLSASFLALDREDVFSSCLPDSLSSCKAADEEL